MHWLQSCLKYRGSEDGEISFAVTMQLTISGLIWINVSPVKADYAVDTDLNKGDVRNDGYRNDSQRDLGCTVCQ